MDFLITVAIGSLLAIAVAAIIIARGAKGNQRSANNHVQPETENVCRAPIVTLRMKKSAHMIPNDPRFFNIGSHTFHKSRDCQAFVEGVEWEACTEEEAIKHGLRQCALCVKPIAFVYGHSHVYHTTTWCSDAMSQPFQIFEEEALAKGFRKCKNCQKREDGIKE